MKSGTVQFQCQLKGRVITFKGNNGFHPCCIKAKPHPMDHSSSSSGTKQIRRCLRAPRQSFPDQGDSVKDKYPEEMDSGSEKVAPSEDRIFIMTHSILKAFFQPQVLVAKPHFQSEAWLHHSTPSIDFLWQLRGYCKDWGHWKGLAQQFPGCRRP